MSAVRPTLAPAPFDAVADCYDETFTNSQIGRAQRKAVWHELLQAFRPGHNVLEIGCGTGVDACYLAENGVRVVACDVSTQMIKLATRRIYERGLEKFVKPVILRAEDISALSTQCFDGVFSNFGALNCIEHLPGFARDLARLLKPGARGLLCWMGRYCLWEIVWYLAHANGQKAFRRLLCNQITASIGGGALVSVHYPSIRSLRRTFSPEFKIKSIKGIGLTIPPSYLEPWAENHPRFIALGELADMWMGGCPGTRALADHILVGFERESDPAAVVKP
jgi:ubiquinone/menaquinone biosynthesis C-methylase UbiE